MKADELVLAIAPGRYVVAVSGGVDSMVLLDMARRRTDLQVIAAHVDHGIRSDSHLDRELVQQYTISHNIVLETQILSLGPHTSEAAARKARYTFLQQCRIKHKANAILTAHHQDDVIETAIIAIMRGTSWRGMAPFANSRNFIVRPLLGFTKQHLIAYARRYHLQWREDTSNYDESYLRNFVRHTVVPQLNQYSTTWHAEFLRHIRIGRQLRRSIEKEADIILNQWRGRPTRIVSLPRYAFIMVPAPMGYEILQRFLQLQCGNTLQRSLAEAALLFIKTARPGKVMPLNREWQLGVTRTRFIVERAVGVVS